MLNTLIVEDNAAHRQSLHDLLARKFPSMRITEAADGEEALREAMARRYDLVFMDIRLPRDNGLNLTRSIKTIWSNAVVCIITSYDIAEYREAAFLNGAEHFVVKGDSTEAEIVAMVESLLQARFISLVIISDPLSRRQLSSLLTRHWPAMMVAEADSAAEGLNHAATLKPRLILLELTLPGGGTAELVRGIRGHNAQAVFIGMSEDGSADYRELANDCGMDYCVSMTPYGHSELVSFVDLLKPGQLHH